MPILYENRFSRSVDAAVTAQKRPTESKIYLWNEAKTERMEGKTVYTGTVIYVRVGIFSPTEGKFIGDRTINIYRKVGTGEPFKVGTVTSNETPGTVDFKQILMDAGIITYYCEFTGDALYEGCSKAVQLLARTR